MAIKRKVYRSGYVHICQKSADNGIIFNIVEDFLVLFTILSVKAAVFGVVIFAIAIMFNHFHIGAVVKSAPILSAYMNSSTSVFAKLYNKQYGLEGQLFKKPFKSAPKYNEKKIRENLFYIWNNPVEKRAASTAEEYRWNFLKYMGNEHPFSEPMVLANASKDLLRIMRKVKNKQSSNQYLDYSFFDDTYNSLSRSERLQLIDFIIVTYSTISKEAILEKFGDYQSLVQAVNTISGTEYDMVDDDDDEDYRHYRKMISIVKREGIDISHTRFNRDYFSENGELLTRLRYLFKSEVGATDYEINKFLHLL